MNSVFCINRLCFACIGDCRSTKSRTEQTLNTVRLSLLYLLRYISCHTASKPKPIQTHSAHHRLFTVVMECTLSIYHKLECGPMPNLMVALPNTGGALCSTPQSLADAHYYMPCSNAAKTRNPLKFAGVPQTTGWISAVSRPMFIILWGHVEDISLLNKFFSDCRYVP